MNRMKNIGLILCGLVLGLTLSSPAARAVGSLKVTLSTNRILVDGKEVRLTAYNINGNNYVMLRDVGKTVGFEVYWDGDTKCVQIESDKPYTGEAPVKAGTSEPASQPEVTTPADEVAVTKQDIVDRTNALRRAKGVAALRVNDIALYYSGRENRRPGEEYGSAKWGNPKELNRKYMDHQHKEANIILTQHVRLGMDGYITQRNMNILVVGGSGSGKTRFFCKPGVYSANCSYLITDPKGELLRASGGLLKNKGYDVKVFNLIDPSQSDCYNPFVYVHNEKDVLTLIDNLIKNTTPRNASSNDPFWEKAEIALDSALMLYLISEAPPEERNFETMLYMMNFAEVREDDDQYRSPLDMLFRALEEEQPNHVAVKQYKVFKQAAGDVCSK